MIFQKEIVLSPFSRGFHLITDQVSSVLPKMSGLLNVFIKHTSASLTINENADPTVREDFETSWFPSLLIIFFIHWKARTI